MSSSNTSQVATSFHCRVQLNYNYAHHNDMTCATFLSNLATNSYFPTVHMLPPCMHSTSCCTRQHVSQHHDTRRLEIWCRMHPQFAVVVKQSNAPLKQSNAPLWPSASQMVILSYFISRSFDRIVSSLTHSASLRTLSEFQIGWSILRAQEVPHFFSTLWRASYASLSSSVNSSVRR